MDIREYTSPTLPVAQFVERYVDTDHYDAGCRGCDNYGQVWVCPPYDFSVSGYWSGFREVCLRGVQLRFSPEEQARSYHPEDLAERLRQLFSRTARQMILRLREEYPRSDILTVGGCHLCEHCTRPKGRPCRYPEGIGYTLESLGCDVSAPASFEYPKVPIFWTILLCIRSPTLRRSSCWAGRFCGAGRDACRSIWRWSAAC